MKRYEYKCVFILGLAKKTTKILNEYGKDGWELVNTWFTWFYFKKQLD